MSIKWKSFDHKNRLAPNPLVAGTVVGPTTGEGKAVTTEDPRFCVVTLKLSTPLVGSLELWDTADGFLTEVLMQSVALDASGTTVLRYDAATNGLLRDEVRAKVSGVLGAADIVYCKFTMGG